MNQVWSKNSIKNLTPFYKVEFGTMVDERNPDALPVKLNENLVIVLDTFKPNSIHVLTDNLLSIYEQKIDSENSKNLWFISKLTKKYDQKNLELNDLYQMAAGKRSGEK